MMPCVSVRHARPSLWSLLEMLTFYAARLVQIQKNLAFHLVAASQANISEESVKDFVDNLETLRTISIPLELKSVTAQIDRIRKGLGEGLPNTLVASLIMELQNRITDELQLQTVLMIPFNRQEYYKHPLPLFGKEVHDAFPTAAFDIDEAGKCLAVGRATACVFHLQRAVEVGLKVLAVSLGQPFDRNSWDAHMKDVERELSRRYKASGAKTAGTERREWTLRQLHRREPS